MKKNKFNKMQFLGSVLFCLLAYFFYRMTKLMTGFVSFFFGYGASLFAFAATSNLIDQFSDRMMKGLVGKFLEVALTVLFVPLYYFPSSILIYAYYNCCLLILSSIEEQRKKELCVYLLLTLLLFILRFYSKSINDFVYAIWSKNAYLNHGANYFSGTKFWKFSIYFIIAIVTVFNQIDKAFYNVFSDQFENVLVPSAITLIAAERVMNSIKSNPE